VATKETPYLTSLVAVVYTQVVAILLGKNTGVSEAYKTYTLLTSLDTFILLLSNPVYSVQPGVVRGAEGFPFTAHLGFLLFTFIYLHNFV
jgi:hypothetical protein